MRAALDGPARRCDEISRRVRTVLVIGRNRMKGKVTDENNDM